MGESCYRSKPSKEWTEAVSALRHLIEKEGLNEACRAYAEAVRQFILDIFVEQNGVSLAGGSICVLRLRPSGQHQHFRTLYKDCQIPGADHMELWNCNGKPLIYTSQPYGILWEDLQALVRFCQNHGLCADLNAGMSWYSPGRTILVKVKKL